jgi:hypothetical protein
MRLTRQTITALATNPGPVMWKTLIPSILRTPMTIDGRTNRSISITGTNRKVPLLIITRLGIPPVMRHKLCYRNRSQLTTNRTVHRKNWMTLWLISGMRYFSSLFFLPLFINSIFHKGKSAFMAFTKEQKPSLLKDICLRMISGLIRLMYV